MTNPQRAAALEHLLVVAHIKRNAEAALAAAEPRSPGRVALALLRKEATAAAIAYDDLLDELRPKAGAERGQDEAQDQAPPTATTATKGAR